MVACLRTPVVFAALICLHALGANQPGSSAADCPWQETDIPQGRPRDASEPVDVFRFDPDPEPLKHPLVRLEPGTTRYLNGVLVETHGGRKILVIGPELSSHSGLKNYIEDRGLKVKRVLWSGKLEFRNNGNEAGPGELVAANETSGMVAQYGYKDSSVANLKAYLDETQLFAHAKTDFRSWEKTDKENPHLDPRLNGTGEENFRHFLLHEYYFVQHFVGAMRDPGEDAEYRAHIKLRFTLTYDEPDAIAPAVQVLLKHLDLLVDGKLPRDDVRAARRALRLLTAGEDLPAESARALDRFFDVIDQHLDQKLATSP